MWIRCGLVWRSAPASGSSPRSTEPKACPAATARAKLPPVRRFRSSRSRHSAPSLANTTTAGSPFTGPLHLYRRQFLIDDTLIGVVADGAKNQPSVDEDCRSRGDAEPMSAGHVLRDRWLVPMRLDARVELTHVDADVFRVMTEIGRLQAVLVVEQLVVVFPERVLLARAR